MIPQEALTAAVKAMAPVVKELEATLLAQAALEAAAPYLRAQALMDAADEFGSRLTDGTGNGRAYNSYRVAELLKARAATERGQGG